MFRNKFYSNQKLPLHAKRELEGIYYSYFERGSPYKNRGLMGNCAKLALKNSGLKKFVKGKIKTQRDGIIFELRSVDKLISLKGFDNKRSKLLGKKASISFNLHKIEIYFDNEYDLEKKAMPEEVVLFVNQIYEQIRDRFSELVRQEILMKSNKEFYSKKRIVRDMTSEDGVFYGYSHFNPETENKNSKFGVDFLKNYNLWLNKVKSKA